MRQQWRRDEACPNEGINRLVDKAGDKVGRHKRSVPVRQSPADRRHRVCQKLHSLSIFLVDERLPAGLKRQAFVLLLFLQGRQETLPGQKLKCEFSRFAPESQRTTEGDSPWKCAGQRNQKVQRGGWTQGECMGIPLTQCDGISIT